MFSMMPSTGTSTFLEHVEPLACVDKGDVLWCRDDDRAGERHLLRHRQLRVAGAGRHVDDHDVEVAPLDLAQHLLQRAHHHRPAPDHRRVLGDEKPHRHHLKPVILHRLQGLAVARAGPAGNPQHARHRRAIDVGVEHPDSEPVRLQAEREVGGDRRFADPALARGDGDDRADPGDRAALRPMRRMRCRCAPGPGCCARRWRRRRDPAPRCGLRGQHRGHREHPRHRVDGALGGLAQRLEPRPALGLDLDRKGDVAVADRDPRDHAERDDVGAALGVAIVASASRTCFSVTAIAFPNRAPVGRNEPGAAGRARSRCVPEAGRNNNPMPAEREIGQCRGTGPRASPDAVEFGSAGGA